MVGLWHKEIDLMRTQIARAKDKSKKHLVMPLTRLERSPPVTLFKEIIYRAKIIHSLAFFQWRSVYESNSHYDEIKEIFSSKIAWLKENVKPLTYVKEPDRPAKDEKEEVDIDVLLQIHFLDKTNTLKSFDEIGLYTGSKKQAKRNMDQIEMTKFIYPDKLMTQKSPPKCVFMPDKSLIRSLIKLALKDEE